MSCRIGDVGSSDSFELALRQSSRILTPAAVAGFGLCLYLLLTMTLVDVYFLITKTKHLDNVYTAYMLSYQCYIKNVISIRALNSCCRPIINAVFTLITNFCIINFLYTVSHRKHATLFFTIALLFLDRLLQFLYAVGNTNEYSTNTYNLLT